MKNKIIYLTLWIIFTWFRVGYYYANFNPLLQPQEARLRLVLVGPLLGSLVILVVKEDI